MESGVPVKVINHFLNLFFCHLVEYGLVCEVWVDCRSDVIKVIIDVVKNLIGFDHHGSLLVFLLQVVHLSTSIGRLYLRGSEREWLILELTCSEIFFRFNVGHFVMGQIRVFLPQLFAQMLITTDLLVGLICLIWLEHPLERFF